MDPSDPEYVDYDKLRAQQLYYSKLRRLSKTKLLAHHKHVFPSDHRYFIKLPKYLPRHYLERRLYFYYCANKFHLSNKYKKAFFQRAHKILTHEHTNESLAADLSIVRDLTDFRKFTPEGVLKLPEARVDTYLVRLGYDMQHLPLDEKRQILVELYTMHPGDIVPRFSLRTGRPLRYKRDLSKLTMKSLILKHPNWCFAEFQERYSTVRSITKQTWYNARRELRKAGYDLPSVYKRAMEAWKAQHKHLEESGDAEHEDNSRQP
jgi:hypothetical protein